MKCENIPVLGDIKILDNATLSEQIIATETIVDACFENDNKQLTYTPYYFELAEISVFADLYVRDINSEKFENINELILANYDLYDKLKIVLKSHRQFRIIYKNALDMIEFRKSQIIHQSSADKLLDTINTILTNLSQGFDTETLSTFMTKLNNVEKIDEKKLVQAFKAEMKK